MEQSEEVKTRTSNQVKINISSQGDVEFDAQGISEWGLTDAIAQATKEASRARQTYQQLQQIQASSLFWMQIVMVSFAALFAFSSAFVIVRVATQPQPQIQGGK